MPTWLLICIIVGTVVALGLGALIFFGRRAEKKQKENEAMLQKGAQPMNLFIIDKKKARLKDAGLPKAVYDQVPRLGKIGKMPLVKVKVANRITTLVTDREVYKTLLPKQEVKAMVSGMYLLSAKRVRGPQVELKKTGKDGKVKENWIDRLR